MDPFTAGLIGSAVVGGGMQMFGQSQANAFNAREAERQRKWQQQMRGTAWQATVKDMRAAGLNPALAYGQGATGAGSGAAAGGASNPFGNAVMEALSVKQMKEQLKLVREQARGAAADADWKKAYNAAHGFEVRPDGSVRIDLTKPGIAQKVQSEISSARAVADLNQLRVPEAKAIAEMWQNLGAGGKGVQTFMSQLMPLFVTLARGR